MLTILAIYYAIGGAAANFTGRFNTDPHHKREVSVSSNFCLAYPKQTPQIGSRLQHGMRRKCR